MEHCGLRFEHEPPAGLPENASVRLVFLGDDENGVALEVMAVELESGPFFVIHAMLLRDRYRKQCGEAKKWQR